MPRNKKKSLWACSSEQSSEEQDFSETERLIPETPEEKEQKLTELKENLDKLTALSRGALVSKDEVEKARTKYESYKAALENETAIDEKPSTKRKN